MVVQDEKGQLPPSRDGSEKGTSREDLELKLELLMIILIVKLES
jgi:hypothetical protein